PRTKKSKHQLGSSPFPGHPHPTPAETSQIATLLREHHGAAVRPPILQPSLTVTGCGEVPLVLDALIRTIISSNTSTANSAVALAGIVAAYGSKDGTINYDAIHERPVEDLEAAMRRAGLATIKSKNIKAILTEVAASPSHQPDTPLIQSLEHLRDLPTTEVMSALMSYKGVGVKIAACVCLFCLQRPVLAIDTHCYRMARFLGWIPEGASVDDTFWHLDAVVGDEWKYELHELFMKHGQTCEKCS
ncbi:DNA glycosylase, partial [Ascobolus immersus RN42]